MPLAACCKNPYEAERSSTAEAASSAASWMLKPCTRGSVAPSGSVRSS